MKKYSTEIIVKLSFSTIFHNLTTKFDVLAAVKHFIAFKRHSGR